MSKDDGGPAFPETRWDEKTRQEVQWLGMTLRDYFAINAPQQVIEISDWRVEYCASVLGVERYYAVDHYFPLLAKLQYQYADAMIAERNK